MDEVHRVVDPNVTPSSTCATTTLRVLHRDAAGEVDENTYDAEDPRDETTRYQCASTPRLRFGCVHAGDVPSIAAGGGSANLVGWDFF